MKLGPLDSPELIELAAGWLARKDIYQWFDFGGGRQIVTPALLKVMTQRDSHFIRIYTSDQGTPIGIVALNSVDLTNRTGTLWGATGDTDFRHRAEGKPRRKDFAALLRPRIDFAVRIDKAKMTELATKWAKGDDSLVRLHLGDKELTGAPGAR